MENPLSRTAIRPQPVIGIVGSNNSGVSGSMGASITSAVTILGSCSGYSYEFSWVSGSTPVGAIGIQSSNSYSLLPNGKVNNAGTWTNIYFLVNGALANTAAVSGNSGSIFCNIPNDMSFAVRLVYTFTSGTATATAIINGKVS